MKKIALNACFAVLLVLVVFFVVLAFGVPIELATAATAFVVACATTNPANTLGKADRVVQTLAEIRVNELGQLIGTPAAPR